MLPLNAITISPLPASVDSGGNQLPPGTFAGRVVQSTGGLSVRAGSVLLPLPEGAPFVAGQAVTVSRPTPGAAIEVRPVPVPPAGGGPGGSVAGTLGQVLAQLHATNRSVESVLPLVPNSAPLAPAQVRQLIALFAMRGELANNLGTVASHLQAALAAGWTAPEWVRSFQQLAGARPGSEPQAIVEWLRMAYRGGSATAEGALAGAAPERAFEGLLAQLRALRGDGSLRAILESGNQWNAFAAHADSAIERLEGRGLQQLHAANTQYTFVELPAPFPDDSSSIHLHWFRNARGGDEPLEQVVLDLHVSRLGDLWVALQTADGSCRCTIRAASEPVRAELERHRGELETSLRDSGYRTATVRVEPWDGDRLGAAAHLMRRGLGLDVDA